MCCYIIIIYIQVHITINCRANPPEQKPATGPGWEWFMQI
jgi:hypothetical protein